MSSDVLQPRSVGIEGLAQRAHRRHCWKAFPRALRTSETWEILLLGDQDTYKAGWTMGTQWRDCVATMIDLVGVTAKAEDAAGSGLMRRFHQQLRRDLDRAGSSFTRAYAWNDSVLLLSYVDQASVSCGTALRHADHLKQRIDRLCDSHVIAVKGRAFPRDAGHLPGEDSRLIVSAASSWALANCFAIEKRLGKLRKPWYVDGRIARNIRTSQTRQKRNVPLLPSGRARDVFLYDGYLWP